MVSKTSELIGKLALNATTCIQTKERIVTEHLGWMLSKAKTATSTFAAQPSEKPNAVTFSLPCDILQRVVVEGPARMNGCFPCRACRRMFETALATMPSKDV
jgi:hypothetical protein